MADCFVSLVLFMVTTLVPNDGAQAAPTATPTPVPTASASAAASETLPPCPVAKAKLLGTIDTKIVTAGARFSYATIAPVTFGGKEIPAGTQGEGIVATMDHSKSHGESGYLVLEARYLELADGSHVPATFVPGGDGRSDAFVRAGSSNAPSVLGYLPYVGTAASVYDYFHHGKDAAVVADAQFALVLGDDLFKGTCFVKPR